MSPQGDGSEGGTQRGRSSVLWNRRFKHVGRKDRQIRSFIKAEKRRGGTMSRKLTDPVLPRKASGKAFR